MPDKKLSREERKSQRRARRDTNRNIAEGRLDPLIALGDMDAWALRQENGWFYFTARLETEARAYMRSVSKGDIIADAPGAILAILAIGGPRRAGFNVGPAQWRYNVLAPGDHVGAVGLEGTATAQPTSALQHLPHCSREALIADILLSWRYKERRALPLYFVRAETDSSASITSLVTGHAFSNLLVALENLSMAAKTVGRPAQVFAIGLDFSLEDLTTQDAKEFAEGVRMLMAKISDEMRHRGLAPPYYFATAETGTAWISDHTAIRGIWELAWCPGPHKLIITSPSYVADQDRYGRLTQIGRATLAELDAHALSVVEKREEWHCPLPLLAEYNGTQIRVVFRSLSPLRVDEDDPFQAGKSGGFQVVGTDRPVEIMSVSVAPDDPATLIIYCDCEPIGASPRLLHAIGCPPTIDQRPINRSAIRDSWQANGQTQTLHRWALPADLPLHPARRPKLVEPL